MNQEFNLYGWSEHMIEIELNWLSKILFIKKKEGKRKYIYRELEFNTFPYKQKFRL